MFDRREKASVLGAYSSARPAAALPGATADQAVYDIVEETVRNPRPIGSYWAPYGGSTGLHDLSFDYSQAWAERTRSWIARLYVFNGGDIADASWFWAAPLIYHELSPGHHFHLDRIEANPALTPYLRRFVTSGFAEGWGEYARSVTVESGVYDDDLCTRRPTTS